MRVFDFYCNECDNIFEKYVKTGGITERVECPYCGSTNTEKRLCAPSGFQFNGKGFEHNKK